LRQLQEKAFMGVYFKVPAIPYESCSEKEPRPGRREGIGERLGYEAVVEGGGLLSGLVAVEAIGGVR
jgi:hypothetical protein